MSIVARIGQKDDGKTWLAACISTIAMAPKEDRLSVLKAQAAEGAQIINFGLLEKQTVVDRFAQIAHSAGFIDEFGSDAVREALAAFGTVLPTQNVRPLSFVKASKFADQPIPIRAWHVADLIPAGNVTLLNGDGGTGKSLIALQLAVATVLGRLWIGRQAQPGRCLFLTAEDDLPEVHRRLADIAAEHGIRLADLDGLIIVSLAGDDALLAVPDGRSNVIRPTGLFGSLESLIEKTGPALVVLDTLADLFGGEEN